MTACWPDTTYPLPDIYFRPKDDQWQVSICLQVGSNTFRWLHAEARTDEIISILLNWRANPIEALASYWNHEPPVQEARLSAPKAKTLSLSDLNGISI